MKRVVSIVVAVAVAAVLSVGSASAAPNKPVVGHFSFGASLPQGSGGDALEGGWAVHGGATWFSANKPIGLRLDFGVDWWDADSSFLSQIDTDRTQVGVQPPDDGDARSWSMTGNFVWEPRKDEKVSFYLTGGVGVYYVSGELTEYGYVGGYYCDWWYCYPYVGTGEYVIESSSSWELGWNAGLGLAVKTGAGWEWYLEATYHWVDTEGGAEYMPIQLGFRF